MFSSELFFSGCRTFFSEHFIFSMHNGFFGVEVTHAVYTLEPRKCRQRIRDINPNLSLILPIRSSPFYCYTKVSVIKNSNLQAKQMVK
jgi:hypothetical protein